MDQSSFDLTQLRDLWAVIGPIIGSAGTIAVELVRRYIRRSPLSPRLQITGKWYEVISGRNENKYSIFIVERNLLGTKYSITGWNYSSSGNINVEWKSSYARAESSEILKSDGSVNRASILTVNYMASPDGDHWHPGSSHIVLEDSNGWLVPKRGAFSCFGLDNNEVIEFVVHRLPDDFDVADNPYPKLEQLERVRDRLR